MNLSGQDFILWVKDNEETLEIKVKDVLGLNPFESSKSENVHRLFQKRL